MLKSNSDCTEVLGDSFGYVIDFVERCASPRRRTGNLVNENGASKAAVCSGTLRLQREIRWHVCSHSPPSDNASLGSANRNIVTNDEKLDLVCLVWVLGSELFLC